MNNDAELKLQAYLDGELPEGEAKDVAKWLAQDQEAVLLLAELRNTRQAVVGSEKLIQLPESREFFWSKIEWEISRLEQREAVQEKPSLVSAWRRFLLPASAIAALGLAVLLAIGPGGDFPGSESEASREDSGAFTYRDDTAQATLVWLAYPAENEVAESKATDTVQ
jgi:negative regulator of sigma E activity